MGYSLKINVVYDKTLTTCENFRGRVAMWHALQKKRNGWMSTTNEKISSLYKLGGRNWEVKQPIWDM